MTFTYKLLYRFPHVSENLDLHDINGSENHQLYFYLSKNG
jgi:hypothetical protein